MRRLLLLLLLLLLLPLSTACGKRAAPITFLDATHRWPFDDKVLATLDTGETRFDGRVRLLAADVQQEGKPGAPIEATLYWLVERDLAGRAPRVFVHVFVDGGEKNVAQFDHDLGGVKDADPGDVVVDKFVVVVPAAVDGHVVVAAGLYEGEHRWSTSPGAPDDRLAIATVDRPAVVAEAAAAAGAIVVDGVLDEADWAAATPLPLKDFMGRDVPLRATTAKLVWTKDDLYLAFVADDPDVFSPYTKRDDPLYESEAYEIFIDADGDAGAKDGEYVELQSNAFDVHFDSAFAGGRRQHMEVGYDVPFETKTVVSGTTVTQEWRIPVAALRGIPPGEPRAGAEWRINLFRLERKRRGEKTIASEASAWSPPLSNDFHNVARFGRLRFR